MLPSLVPFGVRWTAPAWACFFLLIGTGAGAQTPAIPNGAPVTRGTSTIVQPGGDEAVSRLKIGPGDLLEITVFDEPELTQSIRVSDTGNAELSLLGSLHLAGMSTSEAQTAMEHMLRERNFLLNPHVSILIREYSTQGISILGEVKNPGVYPILGSRNLIDILSQAGGVTSVASNQAIIKHRTGTEEKVKTKLSNKNPDILLAPETALRPGDTVFVPRAGIVYVLGNVGRPGGYVMQDDGQITLLQAISLAAGTLRTAAEGKTRLLQKTPAGFHETQIDLKKIMEGKEADFKLEPEDIVYVPTSTFRSILLNPQLSQAAASSAIYQGVAAIP